MTDSIIDGLVNWLALYIAGWLFFLGGVFVYFVSQYEKSPVLALKLFDVFGGFHKKILANLFFSANSWASEDEKLLQEFNSVSRNTGIISTVISAMLITLITTNFGVRTQNVNNIFDKVNYGFWFFLMLLTILWFLRSVLKIFRTHKILQTSIKLDKTSTELD